MARLVVWEPFYHTPAARRGRDIGATAQPRSGTARRPLSITANVAEDSEGYIVEAVLPGVTPNDLEIELENQTLTIRGESRQPEPATGVRYHLQERVFGRFERVFQFRMPLDSDHVQADYDHGILTLRLPRAERVRPRRIEVQTQPQIVEG